MNKKVMGDIIYGYTKSKRMTDNAWDEQIVNNIKVKKIHIIKPPAKLLKYPISSLNITPDDFIQDIKDMPGIPPVEVWDSSTELEIYTRQVVAKEIGRKI